MEKKNLKHFQSILEQRKEAIIIQLSDNAHDIEDLLSSEPSDNIDFSTLNTSSQIEQTIADNLITELKEIELSLRKIQKNTYGICELCSKMIDLNRIKIKPHARYCKTCREFIEKEKK